VAVGAAVGATVAVGVAVGASEEVAPPQAVTKHTRRRALMGRHPTFRKLAARVAG
jgi:hypothetical protein